MDPPCVRLGSTTPCLLDLPLEVLFNILRQLQPGERSCKIRSPGLGAFRQVSKAARRVADAAVELICYDYQLPESLACLRTGPLSLVLLRHFQHTLAADFSRCANARRLKVTFPLSPAHLHRWLLSLADSQPQLQELTITLDLNEYDKAPPQVAPPQAPRQPGHFSAFSRFPHLHKLSLSDLLIGPSTMATISALPALRDLTLHVLNTEDFIVPCMPRLLALSLEGTGGLEDAGQALCPLVRLDSTESSWSALTTLRLSNCRLPQLWHVRTAIFPRLTRLEVVWVRNWRDTTLHLSSLTTLEWLDIRACVMEDTSDVSALQRLQTLKLSCAGLIRYPGLSTLHSLRSLTLNFNVSTRPFDADALTLLTSLRTLHVRVPEYTERGLLPPISGLTLLEDLSLSGCLLARPINAGGGSPVNPPGVPSEKKSWPDLGALIRLRSLHLDNVDVDELTGVESLMRLENLFLLGNRNLKQMPELGRLTALRTLVAYSLPMHRVPQLEAATSLRKLHLVKLRNFSVGRGLFAGLCQLPHLGHLQRLRDLRLEGLGPTELPWLESLKSLESLTLANLRVEDLPPLDALSSLRVLQLRDLALTSLPSVHALTSLHTLALNKLHKVRLGGGGVPGLAQCTALLHLVLNDRAEGSLGDALRLPRLQTLTMEALPCESRTFEVPGGNVLLVMGRGRTAMISEAECRRLLDEAVRAVGLLERRGPRGFEYHDGFDSEMKWV